ILCNGFDLSAYLQSFDVPRDQDLKDATTFASNGFKEFVPGVQEISVKGEGFYGDNPSADSNSADYLFNAMFGAGNTGLLTIMPEGGTAGNRALIMNSVLAKYQVNIKVADLLMALFEAKATGANGALTGVFARGISLMYQTVTGSVNGSTIDNGATSVGWCANAHNSNSDGTLTVKVQHSSNGSVWADLITFGGALASKTAAQSVDTTTTVNRYRRSIVSAIGGTTNKASVGFASPYAG
ncbi:MAG: hypothetical protein JO053_07130, partial [Acidobacteria bacterium]|nr:hypothetical protein [Acidobacteriota bacterium]